MIDLSKIKKASNIPIKSVPKHLEEFTQNFPELFSKNAFAPVFRSNHTQSMSENISVENREHREQNRSSRDNKQDMRMKTNEGVAPPKSNKKQRAHDDLKTKFDHKNIEDVIKNNDPKN